MNGRKRRGGGRQKKESGENKEKKGGKEKISGCGLRKKKRKWRKEKEG